jgi:predicted TIM-barrel fold metal-dependent hydrolase
MPLARLKAMDSAGIDYSVLYPTVAGLAGETFGRLEDPELELACVQAYNDWLIDEWAGASDRFIPQCIVPVGPIEATVTEIKRAIAKGHRGVVFPSLPMHLRSVPHVSGPEYDPVWTICEDLNVPVCLHAGASSELQYEPFAGINSALAEALNAVTRPVSSVFVISLYSFSRVLLRHPRLRIVLAESALSGACSIWSGPTISSTMMASPARVWVKAFGDVPPPVFPHLVVRRRCAFLRIRRRGEYSLVHQFSLGDFELAAHGGNHRALLPERPAEDREKVLWKNAASLYRL